jgi:two-component system, OmpR family, sensor kinase
MMRTRDGVRTRVLDADPRTGEDRARIMDAPDEEHPGPLAGLLRGARTRILAAFLILLAFSTLLSVLAIRQLLLVRVSDRVDAALTQELEEFRTLVGGNDPETGEPFGDRLNLIFDTFRRRNVPAEGETLLAYLDGEEYFVDSSARGGALPPEARQPRWATLQRAERGDVETPIGTVRYLATPIRFDREVRGVFVVAASLTSEREEVEEAVRLAALVLVSVLLIASALAWVVAGRVLAPLRLLADTARAISESDLTRRIPVAERDRDEIADLSRTFNAMLDRLEDAFDSQRAFVSDASHELRTPITIVRGHLELLGEDPDERRETIALVTDELDRMSRFVDDLLLLAKAQRDDFLKLNHVELGALTDELFDKAVALGPRDWRLEARAEGVLVGDRQRLTQAVMGLAQNAVQHTGEDDPIWIGSDVNRMNAFLWVRDSGPGVAAEDQQRIFDRFARASASRRRSEGAGLGLAIVKAIAEAHGGRVALSSRPGAGATFTVIIPLEGQ